MSSNGTRASTSVTSASQSTTASSRSRAKSARSRIDGAPSEAGWLDAHHAPEVRLLVDAHVPGSYGGAGVLADWGRAAELARRRSIMLAGGLTPENVDAAIRQVRPWGVDVSSGVETNGLKDVAKIRAFVAAARTGDQQLASEQTQAR